MQGKNDRRIFSSHVLLRGGGVFIAGLAFALTLMFSPIALALGLGQGSVQSYLDQPLVARIDLISRSEAEMATVTAGLASAADFQVMGLSSSAINTPLEFTVMRDLADPHVRITSRTPVKTPVVQIVVEVVWSSGRMLRQYTLFLDPPTFASPAPLPNTTQRQAPSSRQVESPSIDVVEQPRAETSPFSEPITPLPEIPPPPPATTESVAESSRDDAPVIQSESGPSLPDSNSLVTQNEPVADQITEAGAPTELAPVDTGPPFDPVVDNQSDEALSPQTPPAANQTMLDETVAEDVVVADGPAEEPVGDDRGEPSSEPELVAQELPDSQESATASDDVDLTPVADVISPEIAEPLNEIEPASAEPVEELVAESVADTSIDLDSPGDEGDPVDVEELAQEATQEATQEASQELGQDLVQAAAEEPVQESALDTTQDPDQPVDAEAGLVESSLETNQTVTDVPTVEQPEQEIALELPEPEPTQEEAVETVRSEAVSEPALPVATNSQATGQVRAAVNPVAATSGDVIEVKRGDTLWSLAKTQADQQGVGVNQMMLAMQQTNPNAFINDNINALKAGSVLRIPVESESRRLSAREAMLEVMRQEALYQTRWTLPDSPDDLPTIADAAQITPADSDTNASTQTSDEPGTRLELVPPVSESVSSQEEFGQGNNGDNGVRMGESVVEELSRAQEELANAQQENAYLAERIAELEGELAREEASLEQGIADSTLADMEERLRQERLNDEQEPPVSLTPPDQPPSLLSRLGWWLAGLLALLVAGLVYMLRQQRELVFDQRNPDEKSVEDVLSAPGSNESSSTEPTATSEPDVVKASDSSATPGSADTDDAVELDIDDPETRLDLARAYLAMGRIEQVRELLDEVVRTGDAQQVSEAREMLSEL